MRIQHVNVDSLFFLSLYDKELNLKNDKFQEA